VTTLTLVKAIFSRSGDQAGSVSHDSCVRLVPFAIMVQISLMYDDAKAILPSKPSTSSLFSVGCLGMPDADFSLS
jgi:hypothetical protein